MPHDWNPRTQYAHLAELSRVLTDYERPEDGSTVFLPGSHCFGHLPQPHEIEFWREDSHYEVVPIQAKAGSLVVWHGNTWHGAMGRTSVGLRVTLVLVWMRSYMKPINTWDGVSPDLIERYPELTRILGLEHPYPHAESGKGYELVRPFMAAGLDQFA